MAQNKYQKAFLHEASKWNVNVVFENDFYCVNNTISIPTINNALHVFIAFHELSHFIMHTDDKRDYNNVLTKIQIELEADNYANSFMKKHHLKCINNPATSSLIAKYLMNGNKIPSYKIEIECDRFVILYKNNREIFSQCISNL